MSDFQFELRGINELTAKLDTLDFEVRRKGGRAALRRAANLVRDAAIQNARQIDDPDTAEQIAKNITVRWSTKLFRRSGDLGFRVGVLGGAKNPGAKLRELGELPGRGKANPGGDTWYWRLLEFGTSRTRAQPFMRPALDQNVQAAADLFVRELGKTIDRAIRKRAKSTP